MVVNNATHSPGPSEVHTSPDFSPLPTPEQQAYSMRANSREVEGATEHSLFLNLMNCYLGEESVPQSQNCWTVA